MRHTGNRIGGSNPSLSASPVLGPTAPPPQRLRPAARQNPRFSAPPCFKFMCRRGAVAVQYCRIKVSLRTDINVRTPDMRGSPSSSPETFSRDVLAPIRSVVGEEGIITDPRMMEPYLNSWRDNWRGRSPLIVRPLTTEQMSRVVQICAATLTAIVPQGGNTGVTGAGQPREDQMDIVVSTGRMNRVREIDAENDTMTVEAGCVLAAAREAAAAAGRLFPLNFGAVGSCQIGGNISTNAGGINVLRYGNTRNLVAGLEVVLPDGGIWNGLRGLRKDNAGYDLKQIFIGAEGTLGIITAATLRLSPLPKVSATALLATHSPQKAVAWLGRAKAMLGDRLTSIELIERICIDVACKYSDRVHDPLDRQYPWYLLVELADQDPEDNLEKRLLNAFERGVESEELLDGVIASSAEQAAALWRIRET